MATINLVKLSNFYINMTDEEIISRAKNEDHDAWEYLIYKYKNFVRAKAKPYFLIGADKEDILQEGMFGLYKAIRDFNEEKPSSFKSFAELCIRRQIITAIKTATRQKHFALNSSISLNKPIAKTERTLMDTIEEENINNPEALMIVREEFDTVKIRMQNVLSKFEWKVISLYLNGMTYDVMSKKLKKSIKSIDNALQRSKRKLSWYGEDDKEQNIS